MLLENYLINSIILNPGMVNCYDYSIRTLYYILPLANHAYPIQNGVQHDDQFDVHTE